MRLSILIFLFKENSRLSTTSLKIRVLALAVSTILFLHFDLLHSLRMEYALLLVLKILVDLASFLI